MSASLPDCPVLSRRALLMGAVAALPLAGWPRHALAQQGGGEPPAPDSAMQQFSFDLLTGEMRALAASPFVAPVPPAGFLGELDYDDYRMIRFRSDRARWAGADTPYRLHAFHMGWLFGEPVRLFEVMGDSAREMVFSTDDFEYLNDLADRIPTEAELPGVAGFRLNMPLNSPDRHDEMVAFLGASYFRALGRDSTYGISARGVAVNTATTRGEEFPRFTRFYLEPDPQGGDTVTVHAALDGPSVTGAYRFVIRPGAETVMEVTARLFMRADVEQLGIAPLTSMFLFSEKNRNAFDDFRTGVHDSDGLRILRADGDVLWRPLNNPPRLAGSYLAEESPRGFGLHQRNRAFADYQDAEARYERRPSLEVEPMGDWGRGTVRLVEIPTDLETNDNIVAFWVPEGALRAGDAREFAYRLRWGDLLADPNPDLARVQETRAGVGGVSGVVSDGSTRKFVIDFKGGMLGKLARGADVRPVVSITGGALDFATLEPIEGTDIWRLVLDVMSQQGATVELVAHVAGYDRKLSETWLYQWINL